MESDISDNTVFPVSDVKHIWLDYRIANSWDRQMNNGWRPLGPVPLCLPLLLREFQIISGSHISFGVVARRPFQKRPLIRQLCLGTLPVPYACYTFSWTEKAFQSSRISLFLVFLEIPFSRTGCMWAQYSRFSSSPAWSVWRESCSRKTGEDSLIYSRDIWWTFKNRICRREKIMT